MPIKNLSNVRRLPRQGKIALGIKKLTDKGKEYPSEVDYFVVPEKVAAIFGEKPKELRIMFPLENDEVFFQQWYKAYGYNLLKCKGDGERAFTWDEKGGGIKEIPCPCEMLEKGECKQIGILQFLLPEVPGAGVWQVATSSRNSIIDINSGISYIRAICGRIRMIPLILRRSQIETQRIEDGKPKKTKHYTLQLDLENISLKQLQQHAQIAPEKILLPPPDESKDDLFYPPNGFEPKQEAAKKDIPTPIKQESPTQEITPKEELGLLLIQVEKAGIEIPKKQWERLNALKSKPEFDKAIAFYKEQLAFASMKDGELPAE